jgi:RNA polymerase sigma factor (sigma-70 family)
MAISTEDIRIEVEKASRSLSRLLREGEAGEITQILFANLERGRVQTFVQDDKTLVDEYVKRVAKKYRELNLFVKRVQIERAEEIWRPLLNKMQKWAYHYFLNKGFYSDDNTRYIAEECTHEAVLMLLNSHFPYDIDFEPWLHVIVQNACRRYIRTATQKKNIPAQEIVGLDHRLEEIEDPRNEDLERIHDHDDLFTAISLLSPMRREAIELLYFKGMSPKEVAKKMRKSIGAVYGLQFHALEDLRKILGKIRNNN